MAAAGLSVLRDPAVWKEGSRIAREAAERFSADHIVRDTPWLGEIEAAWGPAPGKVQSDGAGVFVLGAQFAGKFGK